MIQRKAFQFRLVPKASQRQQMTQIAGCNRFAWNRALALLRGALERGEKVERYNTLAKRLPVWKEEVETSFLSEAPSQTLQQTLKDLDRALGDFFAKTKGAPKFKKRGMHDSFRYPQGFKIEGNRVFLPKIGWMRFRKSRQIEGTAKNITVGKRADEWYISVQVECEKEEKPHSHFDREVGIDMGIAQFATLSDGNILKPHHAYRRNEHLLAKEQRNVARKKKGSHNREKQVTRIQRLHKKIADSRKDYLHKATTWIAKNHGRIVLEDLKVSNMSQSARGTVEKPGRNVAAKSGLNKSILDQGWFEFKRQLAYKLAWKGGELLVVNPKNTSRRCQKCGFISAENRKTQASFVCISCGHKDHADLNAAKNILTVGQTGMACGSNPSMGRKQELLGKRSSRQRAEQVPAG